MYPTDRTIKRLVQSAPSATSLVSEIRKKHPYSMLSDEEIFFLNSLCMCLTNRVRVAELGCYVGGTTSIFGEASPDGSVIEVYDLFEHNAASRERLKDDPDSDEKSFFRVWERNIRAYRSKIHLNRGDLVEKSKTNIEPLDIAYIDIVKHRSLVNPMIHFYGRVKVGGIVLQQDYFHWQSPWLVYQMEHLSEYFELLGDVGYNMTIYRKKKPIEIDAGFDYLNIPSSQIFELFDRAISRYAASKAGMLRVSKLRLAMEIDDSQVERLKQEIIALHPDSPRVMRYLHALQDSNKSDSLMW